MTDTTEEFDWYAYIIVTCNGYGNNGGKDVWREMDEEEQASHEDGEYDYAPELIKKDGDEVKILDHDAVEKQHDWFIRWLPSDIRDKLEQTEANGPDEEEWPSTKWVAQFTKEEWDTFCNYMGIDHVDSGQTMGMLTELGLMPALSADFDGTEWNGGGLYPVDFVNCYYLSKDEEVLKLLEFPEDAIAEIRKDVKE